MSVQVVTVESGTESKVFGVYLTLNLAKVGMHSYMESVVSDMTFKKKLVKKDDTSSKKLMFLQDTKEESKVHVYVTDVTFDVPSGKGKKPKRDPSAPKRNMSAFMLYSNAHRTPIKEANPEATFGEIGRLLGQSWSTLGTTEKLTFTTLAEKEKVKYLSEYERYTTGKQDVTVVESESEPEPEVVVTKKTKKTVK